MAKEKIAFPSDIREDAAFLGVRMGEFLKIIFPASVVGIGCAMLPLPVLIRLIFFIGIPSFALIWIAADIPGHIRRRRRYRREPEEYRFNPVKKQKGMSDLVAVKAFYGPFIEFEDQSLAVVLRLDSTPWHTMEDAEADNVALGGFRMVIRDAYMAKAEILITQDAGRQLLRSEWDRQEKEYGERFAGKSASSFALDRVNYHRNLENSRGEECHLRISLSPEDAEFPRKPGNSEEQREMLAEMLTDLLEAIIKDLTPHHISANVLGAEAVRDLGARQLNPLHYQHQAYSEEDAIAWTMEETEEDKEVATTSSKEQKLKGLASRLQVYSRATVSAVLDKGRGGISAITKLAEDNVSGTKTHYKPSVVLGMGNQDLCDWFQNSLGDMVHILDTPFTPEELKETVQTRRPDLAIIMRHGTTGGLPDADELALWAIRHTPAVLFIVGELDETGKSMAEKVKAAGGYILSCPLGETISGSELVYLVQSIAKELSEQEPEAGEPHVNLEILKKGAAQLTRIFRDAQMKSKKDDQQPEQDFPVKMTNSIQDPTGIRPGGLLAVVSPWRPGLAGRITAAAARLLAEEGEGIAVLGADGYSTAALWLGVTEEELILSDWRVPGSQSPVEREKMKIWAVDPAKSLHMNIKEELADQIKEVRKQSVYTIIDFAGNADLAQTVAFQKDAVILFIIAGGDPMEQQTSMLWLNRLMEGKKNIVAGIDARELGTIPQGLQPQLIIRSNPEEAFKTTLRKGSHEFIWTKEDVNH